MRQLFPVAAAFALLAAILNPITNCSAQGSAFTYQGRLHNGTNAATGSYDLRFALFDTLTIGTQQGNLLTNTATAVSNGLFTVTLNFGNQFPGAGRWLEISVRTNGSGSFTPLAPRQALTPTPYAIFAGAANAAGLTGALPSSSLSGTYNTAVTFSNAANTFIGNGSGLTSLNASNLTSGTVPVAALGNAWKITGNTNTVAGTNFLGTSDNQPLDFRVNNQRAMRFQYASNSFYTSVNILGGYSGNFVSNSIVGATISGGGAPNLGVTNRVFSHFGTIGGGLNNVIGGGSGNVGATIGGGENNLASGTYATVAGGADNISSSFDTTVGGGKGNTASGSDATVAGGRLNTASALYATVPGGFGNVASGNYSFAAGRSASATNQGAFVWADSTGGAFSSTANDQFLIRAAGGVGIGTSTPTKQLDVTGSAAGVSAGGSVDPSVFFRINNSASDGGINNSDVAGIGFGRDSTRAAIVGATYGYDFLDFYVGGVLTSPAMRILGNGNVGIGTGVSNPVSKLQVVGTVTATSFSGDGSGLSGVVKPSGGNFYGGSQIITNGSVGIGTSSPLTDFHVVASQYGARPTALFEVVNCGLACGQQNYQENIRLLNANPNGQTGIGFLTAAGSALTDVPTAWIGTQYGCCYGNASDLKFATRATTNLVDRMFINGISGNVGIGTVSPATKLEVAGEITCVAVNITSDRNAKEQFKPVNAREVLAKVVGLPISEWQYKTQADARHIGPMAQDFREAFALGRDEKHITSVDADGVALAAIQGLNEKLEEKNQEVAALKQSVAKLTELVNRLAAQQTGGAK